MKRIVLLLALVTVSVPALAGDINTPGYTPPPCTQDCPPPPQEGDAIASFFESLLLDLILP